MGTVDDLLNEVCGWTDMEWVKLVGRIAIQADKHQRLRLFWASGRPEAKSMMTVIKNYIPLVEVREKVSRTTTNVDYLAAIFKWEEGEIEIVEDRIKGGIRGARVVLGRFPNVVRIQKACRETNARHDNSRQPINKAASRHFF